MVRVERAYRARCCAERGARRARRGSGGFPLGVARAGPLCGHGKSAAGDDSTWRPGGVAGERSHETSATQGSPLRRQSHRQRGGVACPCHRAGDGLGARRASAPACARSKRPCAAVRFATAQRLVSCGPRVAGRAVRVPRSSVRAAAARPKRDAVRAANRTQSRRRGATGATRLGSGGWDPQAHGSESDCGQRKGRTNGTDLDA